MPTSMQLEHRLNGEDLFDHIDKESAEKIRKLDISENLILKTMGENFLKYEVKYTQFSNVPQLDHIPKIEPKTYSAKEIEQFSLLVSNYQNIQGFSYKFCSYVSSLVNRSHDKGPFTLHTSHIEDVEGMEYLGIGLESKEVTIRGSGGHHLGFGMKSGKITVYGNVLTHCGNFMTGGEIYVLGNALEGLGQQMLNGIITVEGDAQLPVTGGNEGSIFVKGKLHPKK